MDRSRFGNGQLTKTDRAVVRYAEALLRWRWAAIALAVLVTAAVAYGGSKLGFNNSYRAFFGPDNPQLQAFEQVQNTYTKNDNLIFVLKPAGGEVFTPDVLSVVESLTEDAWQLPYAIRVDSVTNYQHTRGQEDDLIVEDLVAGAADLTQGELDDARRVALTEPVLVGRIIAPDAATTGVNVTFELPGVGSHEVTEVVAEARRMAGEIEAQHPDIDVRLTGVVMMNNAFFEAATGDLSLLIPIMYVGIIVIMLVLVRSVSATLATVIVIALSIVTAMGAAGWLNVGLTSASSSAPTIILTLAVADCIHVIVSMFAAMRHGMEKQEAIVESLRINMQPVFLTSATTAIGFLTMNFSDVPPFRDLGNISAFGVMVAFALSVVLLPALLSVLPIKKPREKHGRGNVAMDRLAEFVIRRRSPLLYGGAVVCVGLLALIPLNELNDDFVGYFSQRIEFRRDTDFTLEHLTGINQVSYSIPAGDSNGVSDPEFLAKLAAFAEWYRAQPETVHVSSITDTFQRLNRVLHADDPAWYRLPDQRDLAAQYLLLYELSLPYGLDLNNQLNIDKSSTHFVATLGHLTSKDLRAVVDRSERWLADNAPELLAPGIGVSVMFAHISDRNSRTVLRSAVVGLVLISGLLLIALRSVRMGLISLIPNLLPIGIAFGAWGLLVGRVNVAASVVSGVILGIVVDDTVHFLSKYLRARRERGLAPADAVRFAFHTVGVALVVTTIMLIAGFIILGQSNFALNGTVGWLTALGIAMALIVDFLLLPPLLMKLDRGDMSETRTQPMSRPDEQTATV